jgi:hypothetical protein
MTITQAIEELVAHFQQAGQAPDAEPNFNIFSLLGVGTDEVSHSAFLAWLLDLSGK